MAGRIPAFPGGKVHASAKPWDRHSPEWLGINVQVDDLFHGRPRVRSAQELMPFSGVFAMRT